MYNPTKPYKKDISEIIKQTWETPYISVKDGIYPVINKKFSYPEVDHTDGIGTKGFYHWNKRSFRNAALDALAMNLNDLILSRAKAYKLQNHIILPEDDKEAILKILENLAEECKERNIALTGGETSIHDNIRGLDISITASGFIREQKENNFRTNDLLVGLKSSGLHSNGFTRVREVFGEEYSPEFTRPTVIYSDKLLEYDIHGMMHITGGAYTKLKSLVSNNMDVEIKRSHKLKPQQIFRDLYEKGVSEKEIYQTFNCGIGFILSASADIVNRILSEFDGDIIGRVVPGNSKIRIESMFSDGIIEF